MSNRLKTLVILTPAFPAGESETNWVPSQQLFVKTLKEQFPAMNIIVLTFFYPYARTEYEWREVPVISFNGMQERKLRRVLLWNRIWRRLKSIRREQDVIGLFSFWCGECALVGSYFGKLYGIAHYCWLCGQDARKTNRLVKFIRPRPEELIAMSDFLVGEFYNNHDIRPRHMIPNAIDPDLFAAYSGGRDIDVLGAGSLSKLKRYGLFVEIISALRLSFPGIRAVLCGEGEEKEAIGYAISRYRLDNNISLTGECMHEEVLGLMQRTRLFLHTSEYEGFGVVCLEALYAGAHVISFCRPLHKEIPRWHVVQSPEEMINKASEILLDPARDHGPVLLHTMEDSVKAVMKLFTGYTGLI